MEKHKLEKFELSQNYLAFWDKLEKANWFLEQMIEFRDRDPLDREFQWLLEHPYSEGGWWEYVVDLVDKYGLEDERYWRSVRRLGIRYWLAWDKKGLFEASSMENGF